MAIRGPHAQHRSRRPLIGLGVSLAAAAVLLFLLLGNGDIYSWTNGSTVGLVVTMTAIWVCAGASFIAFWLAISPLKKRGDRLSVVPGTKAQPAAKADAAESRKAA